MSNQRSPEQTPTTEQRPLLRLIGRFRAEQDGSTFPNPPNRRVSELLTYLLLMRSSVITRTEVAALLYPESSESHAAGALRQLISATQRWLRLLQLPQLIVLDREYLAIQTSLLRVDVLEIEAAVATLHHHPHRTAAGCTSCRQLTTQALDLLKLDRPFFVRSDSAAYAAWYNARLREFLSSCGAAFELNITATLPAAPLRALELATQWSLLDRDSEVAHRFLMTSLALLGRRSDALRTAAAFQQRLQQEYRITPEVETSALMRSIEAGDQLIRPILSIDALPVLIGRDHERDYLRTLLLSGQQRLITVCGIGGIGKTALARNLAADLADSFRAGSRLIDLATAATADDLLTTLATAIGLRPSEGDRLLDAISAALHNNDGLIVLDNVEQIDHAAECLTDLVERCGSVVWLVTSRRPLGLYREYRFELHGLADHDRNGSNPALELLLQTVDRIAPYVDRAALLHAGPAIIQACHGVPLAIELAAYQCRYRSPDEIAAALPGQPELLASDEHGRPLRQRSLATVVTQTIALLAPVQQTVVAVMTQFSDTFDLPALLALSTDIADEQAVQQAWRAAIDLGLIRYARSNRCRMHPLIRALILQSSILTDDQLLQIHRRFVRHMLEPLAAGGIAFINEQSLAWADQLAPLIPDIRAAWRSADPHEHADLLRRAALPLAVLANAANWLVQYDSMLSDLLRRLSPAHDARLLRRLHGIRLLIGLYHGENERFADSLQWLTAEPLPQPLFAEQALALRQQATLAIDHQQLDTAWAAIERSRDLIVDPELPMIDHEPLTVLSDYYRVSGDSSAARQTLYALLQRARRLGDRRAELAARNQLALLPARAGQLAEALPLMLEAVEVARAIGDQGALPILLANTARARNLLQGPNPQSEAEVAEAVALARRFGLNYSLRVALGAALSGLPESTAPHERIRLLREILLIDCRIGMRSESIDYGLLLAEALITAQQPHNALLLLSALAHQPICSAEQLAQINSRLQQLPTAPPLVPAAAENTTELLRLLEQLPAGH